MNDQETDTQAADSKQHGLGIVEPMFFHFDKLILENGEVLENVISAYETYGMLNADRSNAILIEHAFSGDHHAAGFYPGDTRPGWWDTMIGPGKAFDTNLYFIICINVISGCQGSTGPKSINVKTGAPYALDFPLCSIKDMVEAQRILIDHLGIEKLLAVTGGSMGGMQTLQWMVSYPNRMRAALPIATTARHSPQQIAFNEVGRQAIMADPNWNHGNYYGREIPASGLSVARMVGHITYMSDKSMEEKFGRRAKDSAESTKFHADFEVESYLRSRGDTFVRRFDANSYLYISKSMDRFDASQGKLLSEVFFGLNIKTFVIAFKSDWLYPAYQSLEIVKACKMAGLPTSYIEIESNYGHDAFLLETDKESILIKHFLQNINDVDSDEGA